MSSLNIDEIIGKLQQQQDTANAANKARLNQALGIYDQIIAQFSEGGSFGAGVESQIERGRVKSIASGQQSLVSSGLYNTTMAAGLGKKYEEEVGQPARLKLEDIRAEKLANARGNKAAAIERVSDTGPSMDSISSLMKSIGAGSQVGGGVSNASRGLDAFGSPLGSFMERARMSHLERAGVGPSSSSRTTSTSRKSLPTRDSRTAQQFNKDQRTASTKLHGYSGKTGSSGMKFYS